MSKKPKQDPNARFSQTRQEALKDKTAAAPVSPVESDLNQPPQLYPVDEQQIHPEQTLSVSIGAFDPDGDNLTFELVSGPSDASLHADTGELTWTPKWSNIGAHNLVVRVTDSHGNSDQTSFVVQVVNAAPQIEPLPNRSTHPGQSLSFQVPAFDPDGDVLTYEMIKGPLGASLDASSGQFLWTPDWSDLGAVLITIRVTDPGGASDQDSCVINVENQRPQMEPMPDQTAFADEMVSFTAGAFDPDGDSLTYQLVKGPSGSTVDPSSGMFTWQTSSADIGSHIVTIRATDPGGASDQRSCIVTVEDSPLPPGPSMPPGPSKPMPAK